MNTKPTTKLTYRCGAIRYETFDTTTARTLKLWFVRRASEPLADQARIYHRALRDHQREQMARIAKLGTPPGLRFSPRGSRTSFTANGEHEQQTRVAQEPRSSILSLLQLSGSNSMFVIPQACEERQADSSNKKTMMPHRDGNRDAGARATLGFQTGANFVVQDAPVFLSAPAGHLRVFQELGRESRNRLQECYLNGSCLLRSISCGAFRKVPFFLRHLWHAVAE